MAGEMREQCAVAGVSTIDGSNAARLVSLGLFNTQNRGQEGTGIAVTDPDGYTRLRTRNGLVVNAYPAEVFEDELVGEQAIGHNRYSTDVSPDSRQPIHDDRYATNLASNGNLPNTTVLDRELDAASIRYSRWSDTKKKAAHLNLRFGQTGDVIKALRLAHTAWIGAYATVFMHDRNIYAWRGPNGIKPLSFGMGDCGFAAMSETYGLNAVGIEEGIEDVKPGEVICFDGESIHRETFVDSEPHERLDIFELIYFANATSSMYGKQIDLHRRAFGEAAAIEHPPQIGEAEDIIVVPVLNTAAPAAEAYANYHKLRYQTAIHKNDYVAKSFILPTDEIRRRVISQKHKPKKDLIKGKHIILFDDSIVRGNTGELLCEEIHASGAKSLTIIVGSPPIRYTHELGVDMAKQTDLIAFNLTNEQIRKKFGANYLGYLSLSGLIKATGKTPDDFTMSCFTGKYPVDLGPRQALVQRPVSFEGIDI